MFRCPAAYEVGEQRSAVAELLCNPSLLTAFASKRGISVARADYQLRQVGQQRNLSSVCRGWGCQLSGANNLD
jgi:NADH:ubiquinone oxidoreductase subunit E